MSFWQVFDEFCPLLARFSKGKSKASFSECWRVFGEFLASFGEFRGVLASFRLVFGDFLASFG